MKSTILTWLIISVYFHKNVIAQATYQKGREKYIDLGEPLFLTKLIENGQIDKAQKDARVYHHEMTNIISYAGFLTINKTYNSNIFFWYIESQKNPKEDPVICWLTGGPGKSSLAGLFTENGPYVVTENMTLETQNHNWVNNHSVLYIDSPIGAGFSFTDKEEGYVTSQADVARDVVIALKQFFKLFPNRQENDFYVTGDSYGAKHALTVSQTIKDYNSMNHTTEKHRINLKGLIMGNGHIDVNYQYIHANYLHHIGLVDFNQMNQLLEFEKRIDMLVGQQSKSVNISSIQSKICQERERMTAFIENVTGYKYGFLQNLLHLKPDPSRYFFKDYVIKPDVRKALHVGNCAFNMRWNATAKSKFLIEEIQTPVLSILANLLHYYRILVYHGNLDITFPYSATENMLRSIEWRGAEDYKAANRTKWYVEDELAGYWKTASNLTEVLIRNCGHDAVEQPLWTSVMATQFTRGQLP